MPSNDVEICEWLPVWTEKFRLKAVALRCALGERALRIDHIGSTSIPGLAAKPIIDIQVSVAVFEPIKTLTERMEEAGCVWRPTNPELTKRYFRELSGEERIHIHVRRHGSWHEQWALLFRDYMRANSHEHAPYAALKRALADEHHDDRKAYADGKTGHLWSVIRRADRWAAQIGWLPGQSDA